MASPPVVDSETAALLAVHGIDPNMLIHVQRELLVPQHCDRGTALPSVSMSTSATTGRAIPAQRTANAFQGHASLAVRSQRRSTTTATPSAGTMISSDSLRGHGNKGSSTGLPPSGMDFPTASYYANLEKEIRSVMQRDDVQAVIRHRRRRADGNAEEDCASDQEGISAAALEHNVRSMLQTRHVRPLPVLQELDRDAAILQTALTEHAAYTARCDEGTLYAVAPGLPQARLRW